MTRNIHAVILAIGLSSLSSIDAGAQVNVTTWHNDLARTGANTQESILTTANVNVNTFGKLFSIPVDGQVFAQPLYLSGVPIGGGMHNVVYVATEHDSVYAIDADSGTIYAQVSLIPPGGTTVSPSDLNCGDINPELGITSTPVIDPASNTLYVVSYAKVSGNLLYQLHALSTLTLAEKLDGPVEIDGSVPGTAPDGNGTILVFNPIQEHQRAGLAFANGHVVIAWGSHCDNAPYHGWLMSYEASTLAQEGVWSTTPDRLLNGSNQTPQGGIWMAGAAPAVDTDGNIYVTSANGFWDGISDFPDSVLKLGPPANHTFPLLDYFTPFDLGGPGDSDVGSAGPILLPPPASGAQLIVQQGKQGTIYLANRSNLGHNCAAFSSPCTSGDTQITEELQDATAGAYSSPVYWNGNLYWPDGFVSAWSVDPGSGLIASSPTSQSTQNLARTAGISLSGSGTTNGILWLMHNTGELFAFDATNLANILWTSAQGTDGRDSIDSAIKFEPPTIANGKVYYGTADELVALGLLGTAGSSAATPTFSPGGGTYTASQPVIISDSTPAAKIYYTTDGTTPTTSSALYTVPVTVSSSETIQAIAAASGLTNSGLGSATYTILQGTTGTPTFSPKAGTYTGTQSVTISDATVGATIYYTTNGIAPTQSSAIYSPGTPISVSASETLQAIAVASGQAVSGLATAAYVINPKSGGGTTPVNYPTGFPSAAGFTLDGGATVAGGALLVTDGGTYENRAVWYSTALNIQNFTTDFTFQITPAGANIADGMTFAIQNQGLTAVGGIGGALGYQDVTPSVAVKFDLFSNSGEGANSTGFYTNGAAPILPAIDLTPSGVNLHSGDVMHAHLTYDGTTLTLTLTDTVTNATFTAAQAINIPATVLANTAFVGFTGGTGGTVSTQNILSWTYTPRAATPTLTPVPGTYTGSQSVKILDSTTSANIYYTTDGTAPTKSSAPYAGPITVSSNETIKAIAVASGLGNSALASARYSIRTDTPTFTPVPGTYTGSQSVRILDSTTSANIYYTTDGSTPTTSSTLYAGPITVSSSETIKTIAVASGLTNSAVGSARYTIRTGTPTFTPVPGTYTGSQSVRILDSTTSANIYYTTDGSTPTTSSTLYAGPITVSRSETIKAIAAASGLTNSAVASARYTIQP